MFCVSLELSRSVGALFTFSETTCASVEIQPSSAFSDVRSCNMNLCERKDTVVCLYDNESPRISAYDIHEWIHMKLRLEPDEI